MRVPPSSRQPRFRLGAVIAVAAAAGLVAWLLLRNNGSSSSTRTDARTSGATAVTTKRLVELAATVHHPIFWLGPKRGFIYELSQTDDGKIYVRYLPAGVDVGVNEPYLTVATYPFAGAFAAVQKEAATTGAVTIKLPHRGIAVLDRRYPESVHIAYPNVNYQVEVFDPTPVKAMQFVSGGQVTNLGRLAPSAPRAATHTPGAGPSAASLADLKALAVTLGHPIYWAGPKPGYTYELTNTANGDVFIRYLPRGVKPGAPKAAYLTVATYPFPGAFTALEKTRGSASAIKLAHGGIAVVDTGYRKSVHVAWRGVGYQVEVYDPSPRTSRRVVASGLIKPVP
jgi:hypothetical protein